MTEVASAEKITRASKSNLALSFFSLRKEQRHDIKVLYAFCRLVDDIADSPTLTIPEKEMQLEHWKKCLYQPHESEPMIAEEVRHLIKKYGLRENYFLEIIAGVEMDLKVKSYETFNDLRLYCYRVASVVGLISIEIFGYQNDDCKRYAADLGLALQLTNILRDVAQDFTNGERIYLPLEDMKRFNYSPDDLKQKKYNANFRALMEFETERAILFYESAVDNLHPEDIKAMTAAEIMRNIYRKLLAQMQRDEFRVFQKDYSLSKAQKTGVIASVLIRSFLRIH